MILHVHRTPWIMHHFTFGFRYLLFPTLQTELVPGGVRNSCGLLWSAEGSIS